MQNKITKIHYFLLFMIGLLWGCQFIFVDVAIKSYAPEIIATGRIVAAALTLLVFFILSKLLRKKPTSHAPFSFSIYVKIVLLACSECLVPFFCVTWGQQHVGASVAAILIGTIPIFTALFVGLFIPAEKITSGVVLSIILGFVGLAVLLTPSIQAKDFSHIYGVLAILLGSMSFAVALTLIRTLPPVSSLSLTLNVFAIAAIPMVIYVLWHDRAALQHVHWSALLAMACLGIFCSGIVYILYVRLIREAGATFASLSNYLVPLFGALLAVVLLGEHLQVHMILALVIIFVGIFVNNVSWFAKDKPVGAILPEA